MGIDRVLKGHDIFRLLSVEEANQISGFSTVKKCSKDDRVFDYNDPASHVYMLMKGAIYLRLPANQPDFSFIISKVEKGELFGLSPLLDSPRYTSTAQCTEDTEVLSIEARPLRELLKGNSLVNQAVHMC